MVALTIILFVGFLFQVNNCECAVRDEHISHILQRLDILEKNVEHLQTENIVLKEENRKLRCSFKPSNKQKVKKLDNHVGKTVNTNPKPMTEGGKFFTGKRNGTMFRENVTKTAERIQVEDKRDYKRLLLGNSLPTPLTSSANIAFLAYLSKSIGSLGSHQPIEYDQVLLNDGTGFDVRHGHFTAPTTGVYVISVSIYTENHVNLYLDLVSNGNLVLTFYADGRTDQASQTNAFPITLKEGEMIWLRAHQGMVGRQLYGLKNYLLNSFGGFLLYST